MAQPMTTPEVLWAQRSSKSDAAKNYIHLAVSVPDVNTSTLKVDLKPSGMVFTGHSDVMKKTYHLDLEFCEEIDVEASKFHSSGMSVNMTLQKKELKEEYWPRLLKDKKKVHFLKTDFERWVDEDEQNQAVEDDFSQYGGMGGTPGMGGGMGGMPGMGGMGGDLGGIDFSKLGGGAGDLSGLDGMGDEGDDDEDMPALEGEEDDDSKKVDQSADKGKAPAIGSTPAVSDAPAASGAPASSDTPSAPAASVSDAAPAATPAEETK